MFAVTADKIVKFCSVSEHNLQYRKMYHIFLYNFCICSYLKPHYRRSETETSTQKVAENIFSNGGLI